jgi:hypothetical protein
MDTSIEPRCSASVFFKTLYADLGLITTPDHGEELLHQWQASDVRGCGF